MDARLRDLLEELHRYGVEHDADKPDRLDRLRNLEPASAQLLSVLARASGARSVLELGTSNGYSTVWLADAVRATGGRLTTIEIDATRSSMAAANLERGGLRNFVDVRVQDAGEALGSSIDEQWDLIFLDAERPAYVDYWPDLQRVLRRGGLLAVDNVLSHADDVSAFRTLITATPGVCEALAPTGSGVLLVVKAP